MKFVPIRKDVLVLSLVLHALVSHVFELIIFFLFAWFMGTITVYALLFPVVVVPNFMFSLCVGYFLSVQYVYFRDVAQIWPVLVSVCWFGTPIFYSLVPCGPGSKASMFNPLYHAIHISRDMLVYGRLPDMVFLGLLTTFAFVTFVVGYLIFMCFSPRFPEYV